MSNTSRAGPLLPTTAPTPKPKKTPSAHPKVQGLYSYACKAKCHIAIAVSLITLIVTTISLAPSFWGAIYSKEAVELARWTAKKDYIEACREYLNQSSIGCQQALEDDLPPPPGLNKIHARSLARLQLKVQKLRTESQNVGSDHIAFLHRLWLLSGLMVIVSIMMSKPVRLRGASRFRLLAKYFGVDLCSSQMLAENSTPPGDSETMIDLYAAHNTAEVVRNAVVTTVSGSNHRSKDGVRRRQKLEDNMNSTNVVPELTRRWWEIKNSPLSAACFDIMPVCVSRLIRDQCRDVTTAFPIVNFLPTAGMEFNILESQNPHEYSCEYLIDPEIELWEDRPKIELEEDRYWSELRVMWGRYQPKYPIVDEWHVYDLTGPKRGEVKIEIFDPSEAKRNKVTVTCFDPAAEERNKLKQS